IPLAHTLLMVVAGTVSGKPAYVLTCLAGACPTPACKTHPISSSSTSAPATPDCPSAARAACAPSCVAGTVDSAPPKFPIGVRSATTINTHLFMVLFFLVILMRRGVPTMQADTRYLSLYIKLTIK